MVKFCKKTSVATKVIKEIPDWMMYWKGLWSKVTAA
jgi:hypothetical protein